jgi:hypothetical protein
MENQAIWGEVNGKFNTAINMRLEDATWKMPLAFHAGSTRPILAGILNTRKAESPGTFVTDAWASDDL